MLLPAGAVNDEAVEREWGVKVFATPNKLGFDFSAAAMADVAWTVLCRVPRNVMSGWLAELAQFVDQNRADASAWEQLAIAMAPPEALAGPVLAAARAGEPLMHPRGVLWIFRELLVVTDEELHRRARWVPDGLDERSVIGEAWFACLCDDDAPTFNQVLLAVWMLHESYHGADNKAVDIEGFLSLTTEMGYRFGRPGGWLAALNRWLAIWAIPDDHPSVADAPMTPSTLRSAFSTKLGLPVDQWLAGHWALCMRWISDPREGGAMGSSAKALFRFPLSTEEIRLSDDFVAAFRKHTLRSLDDLRAEICKRDVKGVYSGLGSLTQSDSLACRNHPVVELPDGSIYPLSLDLFADRATTLHRLLLGHRGREATTAGRMFEAYIGDQLDLLTANHRVVGEAELSSVGDQLARCDALIINDCDYLAIETSFQGLSRGLASGDPEAIAAMADRYQTEADQAVATIDRLPAIRQQLGLPAPSSATFLVVTEPPSP